MYEYVSLTGLWVTRVLTGWFLLGLSYGWSWVTPGSEVIRRLSGARHHISPCVGGVTCLGWQAFPVQRLLLAWASSYHGSTKETTLLTWKPP